MAYHARQRYLAIGHGQEVHITKESPVGHQGAQCAILEGVISNVSALGRYNGVIKLPNPRKLEIVSTNDDQRVRPRNIHFDEEGVRIVVSYLNHGFALSIVLVRPVVSSTDA